MLLTRAACIVVLAGGCVWPGGDDAPSDCDLTGDLDAEIVFADQLGTVARVADQPNVPLISAPQGGHILLIGARVRATVTSCSVEVNAALRDPATSRVIGLEQRPVTIASHGTEWAGPPPMIGLSDIANVAVCPSAAISTSIDAHPYQVEVRVDVAGLAIAHATATITPTCNDTYCHMDCSPAGN